MSRAYTSNGGARWPFRFDERFYSVHEQIDGKTYSELIEKWVEWTYTSNRKNNAAMDYDGNRTTRNQPTGLGNVFFLAGSFGGHVKRTCSVPVGKSLFFPIIIAAYSDVEFPNATYEEDELLAFAEKDINSVKILTLIFDDTVFYTQDLLPFRVQCSFDLGPINRGQELVLPTMQKQQKGKWVADGYWIGIKQSYLENTGNGKLIHFFATAEDGYTQDVTYVLNVGKNKRDS